MKKDIQDMNHEEFKALSKEERLDYCAKLAQEIEWKFDDFEGFVPTNLRFLDYDGIWKSTINLYGLVYCPHIIAGSKLGYYKNITPDAYEAFTNAEKEEYCNWLIKQVKIGFDRYDNTVFKNIEYWDWDEECFCPASDLSGIGVVLYRIKPEPAEEV